MKIDILPVTGNRLGVVTGFPKAPRVHAEASTVDEAMFFAQGMVEGHGIARQQLEALVINSVNPTLTAAFPSPPPAKVWILRAEHWSVPGTVVDAFASEGAAKRAAASFVNDLRGDCITGEPGLPKDADETNFEMKLDEARLARAISYGFDPDAEGGDDPSGFLDAGNENALVVVSALSVQGAPTSI